MAWSTLLAGELPDASKWLTLFTEVRPLYARKTADETVNNSATLQNDDHLFVTVTANVVYLLTGRLAFNGNATADVKIGWTFPSGLTMRYTGTGFSAAGTFINPALIQTDTPGFGAGALSGTTDDAVVLNGLVIVGGTGGTLQMQWAQNTANASNTIMRANSFISLDPLL